MPDPLPWPTLDPMPEGWLGDTPPEVVAQWRRLTPARRLATGHALHLTARRAVAAGVRLREPHLGPDAVAARVREILARRRSHGRA